MNRLGKTSILTSRIPGLINRSGALLVLGLFGFWAVSSLLLVKTQTANAAASTTITFQARLLNTNGSLVADGTYNVEFKLYDTVASGGSAQGVCSLDSSSDDCWWVETRTGANKVTVKNGYLYANLGSVTAFSSTIPWDQELWLTMNIGGTGAPTWDGEMSPRFKVTAVPYALAAAKLQSTSSGITNQLTFATPSGSNKTITIPNATGTVALETGATATTGVSAFVQGGNSWATTGILGMSSNQALNINTNNLTRLTVQADGDVAFNTNTLFVDAVNSRVGIDTATPTTELDVNLNDNDTIRLRVGTNLTTDAYNLGVDTGNGEKIVLSSERNVQRQAVVFSDAASTGQTIFGVSTSIDSGGSWNPRLVVQQGGNVGIGTNNPAEKLQISNAVDGDTTLLLVSNSQANAGGSTNETSQIRFGFGNQNDAARIVAGKESDYTAGSARDSFLGFYTQLNDTATEQLRLASTGLATFTNNAIIQGGTATLGTTSVAGNLVVSDGSSSTITILSATQVAATNYNVTFPAITGNDTFCLVTFANCGGGGSLFTDGGTATYLTSTGDELVIGSTSQVLGAKLAVIGTANQEQLLIRAHSGQTVANPLILAQVSGGTELFRLHGTDTSSIFLGYQAGAADDGTSNNNVGIGYQALNVNTTGTDNVAIGFGALDVLNGGCENVAIGHNALAELVSGCQNTAIGRGAAGGLLGATSDNTAIGHGALGGNSAGNVAVGVGALGTGGGGNSVAIGRDAGQAAQSTAVNNIFLGYAAGNNVTTGDQNIIIGYDLDASAVGVNNELRIGSGSNVTLQADLSTMAAQFNGALTVVGNTNLNANTVLGDASGDTITFTGRVNSHILPSVNDTYDLGSDALRWKDIYLGGETIHLGTSTSDETAISYTTSTDSLTIKNATNSATAFQIQNSASANLFNINSTNAGQITLLGNNSGETSSWNTTTALTAAVSDSAYAFYNGYVYQIGGTTSGGEVADARYARVNADGTLGSWVDTTDLPVTRSSGQAVAYNGYLYYTGGWLAGTDETNTVIYSKINSDGTLGSWVASPYLTPNSQDYHVSVVAKGYLFVIGGSNSGTKYATVAKAKINADGSISSFTTTTSVPQFGGNNYTEGMGIAYANGYIYIQGGAFDGNNHLNDVRYAPVNADGTLGAWTTSPNAPGSPDDLAWHTVVTSNGYLYVMGGRTPGGGGSVQNSVYYAKLNNDGTTSTWTTSANTFTTARENHGSFVANGYAYILGGIDSGSNNLSTVRYARVSGAVQIGGNLDLVGPQAGNLVEGGVGGSITANNGSFTGNLAVNGSATFVQGVAIGGGLSAGQATFQNTANSLSAFQIQSAASSTLVGVSSLINDKNLITNTSFEANSNGWAAHNGATLSIVTSGVQHGGQALQATTSTTTDRGVQYAYYFKPNTTYSFSIYASLSSGSNTTFQLGTIINGSTASCLTGQTINTTTTRYSCTFTTGATTTAADVVYARRTDGASVTMRFDAAQLEYGSIATSFDPGAYDASNMIQNSNLESAINGWTLKGSATVSLSSAFAQFGTRSLEVVASAAANAGAKYSYPLLPSTQYSLSIWMRRSTGSATNINIGHDDDGGTDTNCLTGQTINTTWTNYTCTFTTDGTIGADPHIYVKTNSASASTFYIDGVTFVTGATAQAFINPANNLQVDAGQGNLTLNNFNTGEVQAWQQSPNSLPFVEQASGFATYNGYAYVVAGSDGPETHSFYAKINADGSLGAWTDDSTNPLPGGRRDLTSVTYNGYIYAIGGFDGANSVSTVYYAKLAADGSIGSWATNPYAIGCTTAGCGSPQLRSEHSSVIVNGYVYVIGGWNNTTAEDDVWYAKLLPDGTTGPWASTTVLGGARSGNTSTTANGYIYVIGGFSAGPTPQATVYYARPNANGTISSWSTGTSVPTAHHGSRAVVVNGYIYDIGGFDGTTELNTVNFARLNNDGSIGSWVTSANKLPFGIDDQATFVANGYIYAVGGNNGGILNTTFYTSTSRVMLGGSLDLVGLSGGNLADGNNSSAGGSVGGSITAGNIRAVGALEVQGSASFSQNLGVIGKITSSGLYVNDTLTDDSDGVGIAVTLGDDTNADAVNALNISVTTANTGDADILRGINIADLASPQSVTERAIQIGTGWDASIYSAGNITLAGTATGVSATLLGLPTKTDAGDPTTSQINGGMYYNSSSGKFRCYEASTWKDCIPAGAGGSLFTDGGTATYLTATGDELVIGSTGQTFAAKLAVIGTANQEQLLIRAHSTQSNANPLILVNASGDTELFRIHAQDNRSLFLGYQAGDVNAALDNYGFGYNTLGANTTGAENVAIGSNALLTNVGGASNVAIGFSALRDNSAGNYNIAIGPSAMLQSEGAQDNVALGRNALEFNTSATANIAIGPYALNTNVGGERNIALGDNALSGNSAGLYNIALGYSTMSGSEGAQDVIALGRDALDVNTGTGNIALGPFALNTNVAGVENIAVGNQALSGNSAGSYNIALGFNSMIGSEGGQDNIALGRATLDANTGSNNIAFGLNALNDNTSGGDSIAIGQNALLSNASGSTNIAVGYEAMSLSEGGGNNIALGYQALQATTSNHSIALGHKALLTNTTGGGIAIGQHSLENNSSGTANIAIGEFSMDQTEGGGDNIAFGYQTLRVNTGSGNLAFGHRTLEDNTSGSDSIALGRWALNHNAAGIANIAIGRNAMENSEGGQDNFAVGFSALINTTGSYNVAIGYNAGDSATSADHNVFLGYQAGENVTTGDRNIIIGYDMDATAVGAADELRIGSGANTAIYGDMANSRIVLGGGTTPGTARLTVTNLATSDAILSLRDNTTEVLGVANGGAVSIQNETDSANAVAIRDSAGQLITNVDNTTTQSFITNQSFEENTTGWSTKGSAALARVTTHQVDGQASMHIDTGVTINSGTQYNYALAASTNYTFSFYAKLDSGSMSALEIGYSNTGTDVTCTSGQTLTDQWAYHYCRFTTAGTVSGTRYVYIKQTDTTDRNIYFDRAQLLNDGGVENISFNNGSALQVLSAVDSPVHIQVRQDSPRALSVLNSDASRGMWYDAVSDYLGIGDLTGFGGAVRIDEDSLNANFNYTLFSGNTGADINIDASDAILLSAETSITFEDGNGGSSILLTTGTDQTFNFTPNGTGDIQFTTDANSNMLLTPSAASTLDLFAINATAGSGITTDNVEGIFLQIEGGNGTSTDVSGIRIDFDPIAGSSDDTFTGLLIDGITGTAAVENAITIGTGWDASIYSAGNITLAGTATGVSATLLGLPTKTDAGDPTTSQINGGMYYNSSSSKFRCYQGGAWTDCITSPGGLFTDGGTFTYLTSTTDDLVLGGTTTGAADIWLNDDGGAIFNEQGNSVDFRVEGDTQANLFVVDGSADAIGIGTASPTATLHVVGPNAPGSAGASAGSAFILTGGNGANHTSSGTGGAGSSASLAGGNGGNGNAGGAGGSFTFTGGTGGEADLNVGGAGGHLTLTGGAGGGTSGFGTDGGAGGDIRLRAGLGGTGVGLDGSNGSIRLQTNAGADLLVVNTQTLSVNVGTSDTTGTLLILDTKTNAGDPTGINGAMYYNSNANKFRCYENGAWKDCITAGAGGSLFTDGGTATYLTATGDELVIGSTGQTFAAKLAVIGTSNQEQLLIRAHSTQSNANPLILVNNSGDAELFRIHTQSTKSLFLGYQAGDVTSGVDNYGIGEHALGANTTGSQNIAMGTNALSTNVGGIENIAFGLDALSLNSAGSNNIALGRGSQGNSEGGGSNISFGQFSLEDNTGTGNIALGSYSLQNNTSGNYNTAIGYNVMNAITSGVNNTAIGEGTFSGSGSAAGNIVIGKSNFTAVMTDADSNIAFGDFALQNITQGDFNFAVGHTSLQGITTGIRNIALGYAALNASTVNSDNIAIGTEAMNSATPGDNNVGIGYHVLQDLTTSAQGNIAIGSGTGLGVTDGSNNILFGTNAGASVTIASDNIAIGTEAMNGAIPADNNIAIGYFTLRALTATATENIAIGSFAGNVATSALRNIFLGGLAGNEVTTGDDNIIIGYDVDASSATVSNELRIGSGTTITLQADLASMAATFNGALTVAGQTNLNGNAVFGNATSDTLTFTGRAASDLVVTTTNTYDLGSDTLRWQDGFLAGTMSIGSATNGFTFNPASGPLYVGTARPTVRVTLVPEYAGAVLTGDGSSNVGTMTSDFCSDNDLLNINAASCPTNGDQHNYYNWVTTSQNDYDIYITYQVPSDFDAFASDTTINMYGWRTDSTATTEVQLSLFEGATQCGTTTNVATGTATWSEVALGGSETGCAIIAGDIITFRIRVTANNKTVKAGEIRFDYRSKF